MRGPKNCLHSQALHYLSLKVSYANLGVLCKGVQNFFTFQSGVTNLLIGGATKLDIQGGLFFIGNAAKRWTKAVP